MLKQQIFKRGGCGRSQIVETGQGSKIDRREGEGGERRAGLSAGACIRVENCDMLLKKDDMKAAVPANAFKTFFFAREINTSLFAGSSCFSIFVRLTVENTSLSSPTVTAAVS